jgi:uncharacterized protein (TIGR02270 family)
MATIEAQICEEHARQAAFLWLLRDRAARDVAYDLDSLTELDGRLEAHLDGLRLAGDAGWDACVELFAQAEGGEVFGAAVVAIDRWDLRGVARVLDVGGGAPDLARGLASALGWTPFERVQRILPGLLSPRVSPPLTWIGITACAVHRRDPGAPLGYAILGKNARVRAWALRAAGEIGRKDLLPEIRDALRAEDEACRFWAAWSAALFGEDAAAQVLWAFARSEGPFAERAATMAMRRMDPGVAYTWVQALAGGARDMRVPIAAAAALGDPALVPWIIELMKAPETARLAGGAFTMITGVDLAANKLAARAPEGFQSGPTDDPEDEDVSMDPDESLPWPDVAAVSEHWRQHAAELKRGARYLLGKPMTPAWLSEVLRRGNQQARAAAALELSLRQPGRPVFEVRAPGFGQRGRLSGG